LKLPEEATIYDYLVLSLRSPDIIATFNWDPFLYQAFERNRHIGQPERFLVVILLDLIFRICVSEDSACNPATGYFSNHFLNDLKLLAEMCA
jgi:hypothetical protein